MAKTLYTAIVFFDYRQEARKYRNITNIDNFTKFAKSLDAVYFNLYEKSTRKFQERIYIKKRA